MQFVSSWKDLSKAHQVDQAWEMSAFSCDCKMIKVEPDKSNVPHDAWNTLCPCLRQNTSLEHISPSRCLAPSHSTLGQGWAHRGLAFTIPSAPAKTQILPVFLCGDCISKACGAKNHIWCRNISKPLQICLFDKTFKHRRYRVDILWGYIRLYNCGCHKPHFIMKVPHYGQYPVILTSVNVLAQPWKLKWDLSQ